MSQVTAIVSAMTPEEIILYIWRGAITGGITGLVWLLLWQRRVEKALTKISIQLERMGEPSSMSLNQEPRIKAVEEWLASLNFHQDLKDVDKRLTEIANLTHQQGGELKQINTNLKMVLDNLLKQ